MAEHFDLFTSLRYDPILSQVKDVDSGGLGWNFEKSSPFYMLDYHRDRMLRAALHWGWTKAAAAIEGPEGLAGLEALLFGNLKLSQHTETADPMRVKVLLSSDGQFGVESSTVPTTHLANLFPSGLPAPEDMASSAALETLFGRLKVLPPYDVYVDDNITHRSEYTHYKTTRREIYDQARHRAGLKSTDATKEVLIVNQTTGSVMEGSLTTPYFWRRGKWVTPPVSCKFSQEDGSGGQDGTTRRWALERDLTVEEDINASSLVDGEWVWLSNGVRGFVAGRVRKSKS